MKIKIIRNTVFRKQPVEASEELIEVSDKEARDLIGAGKAVAVKEGPAQTADASMAGVVTSTHSEVDPKQAAADAKTITKIGKAKSIGELYKFKVDGRSQAVEDAINARGLELEAAERAAASEKAGDPSEVDASKENA